MVAADGDILGGMNEARTFELDWSDGHTLKFMLVNGENREEFMKCPLQPNIPMNTMCIGTFWGSTGKWNIKFFDTPCPVKYVSWIESPDEYNYAKTVVGQIGSAKRILVTVKAKTCALIALGADSSHNCAKYEFVIGGWTNTASCIRNGNKG